MKIIIVYSFTGDYFTFLTFKSRIGDFMSCFLILMSV